MIDSINKLTDIIKAAKNLGLKGMAITDHDILSGHYKALQYYKKQCEADESWKDFKLLLGNEIYLVDNGIQRETAVKGQRYPHMILLALDEIGHEQLRRLSSRAWDRSFTVFIKRTPTWYSDIEEIVGANPGHIVATSACVGGIISENGWKINNRDKAKEKIEWCKKQFGEGNFFLELAPARYEDQIEYNQWLIEIGRETNTPLTIATDAHYARPEDREIHSAYLKSKEEERETSEFYQYTYLMTPEEIINFMDYIDISIIEECFANTLAIVERASVYSLDKPQLIPHIKDDRELNPNWKQTLATITVRPEFDYINKFLSSEIEDDQYAIYIALVKLKSLGLSKDTEQEYLTRLEEELAEIWEVSIKINQSLASYMLTVRNLLTLVWEKANSLVGVSRGSAGGHLFNYLIGVTQMNPLTQDKYLAPWRFIHRDRPELADIDVDTESSRRPMVLKTIEQTIKEVNGDMLAVCTFATEGTRSAILTACRGLNVDIDVAQYLTSMIPQERGFLWSLNDCVYGNQEKDRRKVQSLINEFSKHDRLLETALGIEGLISRMGIHACGIVLFNNESWVRNAVMTAPSGQRVTQFDLGDTEAMGGLKFDMLSVEALDKIHACMNLLVEDKRIEWQGTLKKTYDKYLHPDVLERNDQAMWELLDTNAIIDIFQLDSSVGKQAMAAIKPRNIPEMAALNSLMRLAPERGQKTPVEDFIDYKNNPEKLAAEINNLGATNREKEILYNFLKGYTGVLESQESVMLVTMIKEFTNFDVKEANKLRKIIAKKKLNEINDFHKFYIQRGLDNGCSLDILNYIWDVQIKRQLGYSFSDLHTTAYSLIGLQEMNLAHKHPIIYWSTACLTINSGALDDDMMDDEEDEDDKKSKSTNYGKLSSAIGRIKQSNVNIGLPDISKAKYGFTPDVDTNTIVFGLKGVVEISDSFADVIIKNRPYSTIEEFIEKCQPQKKQMINLIKAGAFDSMSGLNRRDIMYSYLKSITPAKSRITLQNMNMLIENNLIPESLLEYVQLYNFNRYIKAKSIDDKYRIDERAYEYLTREGHIDIIHTERNVMCMSKKEWDDIYDTKIDGIRPWMKDNKEDIIVQLQNGEIQQVWDKYCNGNLSVWEMEVLGFYYHDHELLNIKTDDFDIMKITDLPSEPEIIGWRKRGEAQFPIFKLCTIAGTVLDRNNYKHTVTLLTPEGVIDVKCANEQFGAYNKTISRLNKESGKKETIEKSWFLKGTKLIVNGWRSGDQFMARGRSGVHAFHRIIEIDDFNNIKTTRYRANE